MTTSTAALPDRYSRTLASLRHLCVSREARLVYEHVARFATWEPWDVAEYHDGEMPYALAACRAAYRGDRDACLAAMRDHVAEMRAGR